jgi:hypothetical protein
MDQFVDNQVINHKDRGFHDAPSGLKMSHYKIPLAAKVAGTAFLAVLVPIYLHTYGPPIFYGSAMPPSFSRWRACGWKAPGSSACAPWAFCFRNASGSRTSAATFWGFLPTHLALRNIFAVPPPPAGLKSSI